jgi:DNA-binding NtrC family response regulator
LHSLSARSKGPFVRLNCSSIPRGHWEVELFGSEGDDSKKKAAQLGKLDFAHGGTLFLDQVDLVPATTQDKLAEVLRNKRFSRSDNKTIQDVDVRVIASLEVVFPDRPSIPHVRRELFQILNTFPIVVPPLRKRKEDLKDLIYYYLKKSSKKASVPVKTLHKDALHLLIEYPWPGNLRELEAVIEMMMLFAGKESLGLEDLPLDLLVKQMDLAPSREEAKISLKRVRNQFERRYIRKVLERTRGNQTRTAATLGLHRNTLIWKLRELNLENDYKQIVKQRRDRGIGFKDL